MEEEIWKAVPGYEGLYEVSNLGRVRSLDRWVNHHTAGKALRHGRILTPCRGNEPYLSVMLSNAGESHSKRVHRIVAEAFIPNPNGLSDVDHIDCNKLNNRVENLRWCTSAENTRFAKDNGLLPVPPRFSELNDEQKERALKNHVKAVVRSDGKEFKSIADAARDLGVSPGAVNHVLRGLTQTCQGYSFTYLE